VTASLQHIERLGDASLLYVQIPGQPMATVKVEGSAALAAGSVLTLRRMPDQLHLFNSQGIACHRTVELPE
jgi:ABC-type sugar transport system ATPase subunit